MKNKGNSIFKSLISIFCVLTLTSFVFAKGGGDTGGASQVSKENLFKPILMDFAAVGVTSEPTSPASSFIALSEMYEDLGIEFIYLKKNRSYEEAVHSLESNFKNYPKLSHLLMYSMKTMRMAGIKSALKTPKEVEVPLNLKRQNVNVETLVFYDKYFGGIINIKLFNDLGFLSQAGVWVHEALRRLQLTYHFPVSNSDMFKITSAAFADRLSNHGYRPDQETIDVLMRLEKSLVDENAYKNIAFLISDYLCSGKELKITEEFRSDLTLCRSGMEYQSLGDFMKLSSAIVDQKIAADVYSTEFDPGTDKSKFYNDLRIELENMFLDMSRETITSAKIWDGFPKEGQSYNMYSYYNEYKQMKKYQDPNKEDNWSGVKELKSEIRTYLKSKYLN